MLLARIRVIQNGILYWLDAHDTGWHSDEQPLQARAVNKLFPIVPAPDDPNGMAAVEQCAAELRKLGVVTVFPEPDPPEAERTEPLVY